MRVLPWSNTFSVGQVGINFSSFGEPASRFTSATFGKMEEGKIATAWAQFGATQRIHQCI
jgi:hypothetical protein